LLAEEPFKQERPLTFTEIAYELTEKDKPTNALLSFSSDSLKFPAKLPNLKASDNQKLHVVLPAIKGRPHAYMTLQNGKNNLTVKSVAKYEKTVAS